MRYRRCRISTLKRIRKRKRRLMNSPRNWMNSLKKTNNWKLIYRRRVKICSWRLKNLIIRIGRRSWRLRRLRRICRNLNRRLWRRKKIWINKLKRIMRRCSGWKGWKRRGSLRRVRWKHLRIERRFSRKSWVRRSWRMLMIWSRRISSLMSLRRRWRHCDRGRIWRMNLRS